MLARRSRLTLPDGTGLGTPLLIPSISSRGFGFDRGKSKVGESLEYAETFLKDAVLISAYDIAHGHLPKLAGLRKFPSRLPYSAPRVLFIDSGTYESRADLDIAEGRVVSHGAKPWSRSAHAKCIEEKVDKRLPVIVVNYDDYGDIDRQVAHGASFFAKHPTFLHDFLIKPAKAGEYIDSDSVLAIVNALAGFHLIGFTEKELGPTLLERMVTIAKVREGLDAANNSAPIHVFGSLDPVLTPLYFVAGAEVFDGLAWLYLANRDGVWLYGDQRAALDRNWRHHERQRWAVRLQSNLTMLENLQSALGRFISTGGNWSTLEPHASITEEAFDTLIATLRS
jgi:hypothetical protein